MKYYQLKSIFKSNEGFTLIEMIIVISIIAVMSLFVAPKIPNFLSSQRGNFIILTSIIAKSFDDSFIKGNTNYVVLHLNQADAEMTDYSDELFSRKNGVSVAILTPDGKFIDSRNRLLKYQAFQDSFKLEEVLISTGETIRTGNVFVPFYPGGYSDDVVIHILVNNTDRWSVKIFKLRKEPKVLPEYVGFE